MIKKTSVFFLGVRCQCRTQLCRCEGRHAGREGHVDAGDDGERRRKGKADHQAPAITSLHPLER